MISKYRNVSILTDIILNIILNVFFVYKILYVGIPIITTNIYNKLCHTLCEIQQ